MPVSKVYGVVTFYSFFSMTPKGEHPISVCMGTACYVRGAEKVLDEFRRLLGINVGETTPDGKYSLSSLRCVGACGLAPVVLIGEKVFGRVVPGDVERILDDVLFLQNGCVAVADSAEHLRETRGKSVDGIFREVFSCLQN